MVSAKIIFFGTLGVMSHAILQSLLKHKLQVICVVIPGPAPFKVPAASPRSIPVLEQPHHDTIELLAIKHDIPVSYVKDIQSLDTYNTLSEYDADFFLIGCFPYIFPPHLQNLPHLACLNIHPSYLPSYRGPVPQFWQLRDGVDELGVTLHQVTQIIDGGNIIIQDKIRLKDGVRARAIDAKLGELGASLFIEAARLYARDSVVAQAQESDEASYFSMPTGNDFELYTQWTARRAFNFMRGTDEWNQQYRVMVKDKEFFLTNPIAYSPAATLIGNYQLEGDVITIPFAQGLLKAEIHR